MGEHIHYRACHLCEAICGLEIRVRDGRIVSIRGDEADPLSRGHLCPKAVALQDLHEDPDRLRRPQKRIGERWVEVGWDEALDDIADRLAAIHRAHGANSIAAYLGNPSVHNWGTLTHSNAFLGLLRTRNRYSATSVDQLPHQLVAYWLYGHQLLLPVPDIDRSRYILMFGANPMASNGSLWTVPDFRRRLQALQARGGKLVLIDPRRTETAHVADEHHFIRPGADAAVLLAMLNTIFRDGLARPGRLAAFTDGLDAVAEQVRPFTPERAAVISGIAAADIRRIAHEFATSEAAAAYGRMGVSTQAHGTLCQWALAMLNIATGNLDRPGGMMFARPAMDLVEGPMSKPGHYGAWSSRVRGLPEFGGELPVCTLAEEILTPGPGQVKALVTIAGNPVLSTPNGRQLEQALSMLEFMVSIDYYRNETTRFAHYILPPTGPLEHDHYDIVFHHLAVRNTARYNPAVFPKPEGQLHDWEIFARLGRRLRARLAPGADKPLLHRLKARVRDELMARMPPHRLLDLALRSGPYGKRSEHRLSLARLKAAPHGIDLGPLQSVLPQRLYGKDRRIRCLNTVLVDEITRYDGLLAGQEHQAPGAGELWLIGRRHVRSNNSWMHNVQRLVKGKPRHQLLMHPADLAARGLVDGQRVCVRSRVGSLEVDVQATEDIMPGVVSLPHGWGHARPGVQQRIAQAHPGQSVNDLTDDRYFDRLSGNAALNGIAVTVTAAMASIAQPAADMRAA
ncbi:Anaerobic selenocysteine-containing dehydrogenase [Fontimonas thermophila]|uniref:Anaerobic selenocysteine-containing dehydrogenase n=1 Tax=Fontimonas thermophila TaxID=1076937 RepID=A0A1I2IBF9_9GAMM|nr:molybdopterin oxidoreductase family protein [Fontimonas thermophila]SFF39672.1 Anaerobic selenocysteine-containing dehydrogenase [Fontimonas thermophila]